jgi:hypothetical protein
VPPPIQEELEPVPPPIQEEEAPVPPPIQEVPAPPVPALAVAAPAVAAPALAAPPMSAPPVPAPYEELEESDGSLEVSYTTCSLPLHVFHCVCFISVIVTCTLCCSPV